MMRLLLIWQFCFLVTFLCFTQRHIRVVFYVTQRRKVLCFIFLAALRKFDLAPPFALQWCSALKKITANKKL